MVYTIASPDEYLAITGAGIKTVKITKSAWVWPLQRVCTDCPTYVTLLLIDSSANASLFNLMIIV
jgi:hypothetical protein